MEMKRKHLGEVPRDFRMVSLKAMFLEGIKVEIKPG
tara:strand:+ start:54 stop:161 length:108 start_codon:yes stop_codon:yes gene_type:complete